VKPWQVALTVAGIVTAMMLILAGAIFAVGWLLSSLAGLL
jgi:hypothetical protein